MSDVQTGPGWWQASDGKWYPPTAQPNHAQAQYAPAQPQHAQPQFAQPQYAPAQPQHAQPQYAPPQYAQYPGPQPAPQLGAPANPGQPYGPTVRPVAGPNWQRVVIGALLVIAG